jgi:hypothetical protein
MIEKNIYEKPDIMESGLGIETGVSFIDKSRKEKHAQRRERIRRGQTVSYIS